MASKRNKPAKAVRYVDDDFEVREGIVTERNGNLSWVEDKDTGEGSYRAPHEVW